MRPLSHILLQLASVPSDLQQLVCQEAGIAVTVLTWWDENEEDASLSAMQHLRSLTTTGNVLNARRIIETAFPAAKERWQYLEPLQEALLADMQQAQRALITTSSDSTTQPTTNKCIPRRPLLRTRALLGNGAACRDESLDSYGHLSADGCMRTWIPSYANTTPRVGGQVQEGRNWYLYGMLLFVEGIYCTTYGFTKKSCTIPIYSSPQCPPPPNGNQYSLCAWVAVV